MRARVRDIGDGWRREKKNAKLIMQVSVDVCARSTNIARISVNSSMLSMDHEFETSENVSAHTENIKSISIDWKYHEACEQVARLHQPCELGHWSGARIIQIWLRSIFFCGLLRARLIPLATGSVVPSHIHSTRLTLISLRFRDFCSHFSHLSTFHTTRNTHFSPLTGRWCDVCDGEDWQWRAAAKIIVNDFNVLNKSVGTKGRSWSMEKHYLTYRACCWEMAAKLDNLILTSRRDRNIITHFKQPPHIFKRVSSFSHGSRAT